jgi:short-subunit dehydrogenase
MSFFTNKRVVVTGGTDGIGRSFVDLLLARGAKVVTCGRNHDKLYAIKTQYADRPFEAVHADITLEDDCKKLIDIAVKLFDGLDILINNAGISMRALFDETDIDTLKQVMDTNFWGAVYCTKYALPHILSSKGTVAGISSIAGYRGLPGRSGYSASKFALQGWMEALRTELLPTGVNVMWACPGFTSSNIRNTALNAHAKPHGETPMNESALMSSEECADHILEAIEKRKRTIVLTSQGHKTVWINRLLPNLADKLTYKFFFDKGKLVK